ncbi:MAG: DUF72 domain-containing protein [Candidatus Binataceae bacterium]
MSENGPIRIGASGFSYREWLGRFYPPGLPATGMLAYYAQRMTTVEINYTFRAIPKPAMLQGWVARTPEHFRFALKAPERITHHARLRNADESLNRFAAAAESLGHRLGPALFQLPPDFKCDIHLLSDFLGLLGGRFRAAFEFRNRSWFGDATFETLKAAGASLCIAESDKLKTPVVKTASLVYVRLRQSSYDGQALAEWAARLGQLAADGSEVYVFFKHEAAAPELASSLERLIGQSSEPGGR